MLSPGAARLAQQQGRDRPPQGVTYSWPDSAVITAVTAGVATVAYRGATQQVAHLDHYTPTVGDVVVVLITSDGQALILGRPTGTPT